MRNYPRNSPEAAARLLAIVLIADGNVCRSEIEVMNQLVPHELGLDQDAFSRILQTLCEDLLMVEAGSGSMLGALEGGTLDALLDEIDDPVLQRKVLRLATAAADGDRHLSERETTILEAIRRRWEPSSAADPASGQVAR